MFAASAMRGATRKGVIVSSRIFGRCIAMSVLLVSLSSSQSIFAAQKEKPDNSGTNKTDRDSSRKTADEQSNDPADVKVTQQIRQALAADKSLSTYAHNVKVITVQGKVTLRGPVRSDAERQAVQKKAAEVAGVRAVVNDLTVAPSASRKPESPEQR